MEIGQKVIVFGRTGFIEENLKGKRHLVHLDRPYKINNRRKVNNAACPRTLIMEVIVCHEDFLVPF